MAGRLGVNLDLRPLFDLRWILQADCRLIALCFCTDDHVIQWFDLLRNPHVECDLQDKDLADRESVYSKYSIQAHSWDTENVCL